MKTTKKEQEEAKTRLLDLMFKAGRRVYTSVLHVSQSGMSRNIACYVAVPEDTPDYSNVNKHPSAPRIINISWLVSQLCGYPMAKNDNAVKVSGCGMDMGFAVVYDIGCKLFPGGDGITVTGRNGDKHPETDGGYLLKQEWL